MLQTDRQTDRHNRQRSDSIGRTVLQTVAEENESGRTCFRSKHVTFAGNIHGTCLDDATGCDWLGPRRYWTAVAGVCPVIAEISL